MEKNNILVLILAVTIAVFAGVALPTLGAKHDNLCDILAHPEKYEGHQIVTIGFIAQDIESTDVQSVYCSEKPANGGDRASLTFPVIGKWEGPTVRGNRIFWPAILIRGKVKLWPPLQQVAITEGSAEFIGMVDVTEPPGADRDWAWHRRAEARRALRVDQR